MAVKQHMPDLMGKGAADPPFRCTGALFGERSRNDYFRDAVRAETSESEYSGRQILVAGNDLKPLLNEALHPRGCRRIR
jgi:hypothetical protein